MLSTIGRASVRRVAAGHRSTNGAARTIFNLRRVEETQTKRLASIRAHSQLQTHRAYATAAASKTTSTKSATTKASTTKKPAAKKAATSKTTKQPAKKPAKKPVKKVASKPKAKGLTEKQKEKVARQKERAALKQKRDKAKAAIEASKLELTELKAKALDAPKGKPTRSFTLFLSENGTAGQGLPKGDGLKAVSEKFKSLTPEERERYAHIAAQNTAANRVAYKQWIESHSPQEILEANRARLSLRRKGLKYPTLKDERAPSQPLTPVLQFIHEKRANGEVAGRISKESIGPLLAEWESKSPAEIQPYVDRYEAGKVRYQQEFKTVFGRESSKYASAKAA